ncbi:MAG TPA: hypothetical protein VKG26_01715, partial [Bacteroidia bacterium]|nr:hypothetical protein [Bacteroidia bacterium]
TYTYVNKVTGEIERLTNFEDNRDIFTYKLKNQKESAKNDRFLLVGYGGQPAKYTDSEIITKPRLMVVIRKVSDGSYYIISAEEMSTNLTIEFELI